MAVVAESPHPSDNSPTERSILLDGVPEEQVVDYVTAQEFKEALHSGQEDAAGQGQIGGNHVITDNSRAEGWVVALHGVEENARAYADAKDRADRDEMNEAAEELPSYMLIAAQHPPNPELRAEWEQRAESFAASDEEAREKALPPVLTGIIIFCATPFALAAVGIFACGAMLYGLGHMLSGLGDALTCGQLKQPKRTLKHVANIFRKDRWTGSGSKRNRNSEQEVLLA